jgi:hypothetical protein
MKSPKIAQPQLVLFALFATRITTEHVMNPIVIIINQLMSISRSWFFTLHPVPVLRAVIFIPVETSPLVIGDVIDPKRVGDFGLGFTFTSVFIFIQTLKLEGEKKVLKYVFKLLSLYPKYKLINFHGTLFSNKTVQLQCNGFFKSKCTECQCSAASAQF